MEFTHIVTNGYKGINGVGDSTGIMFTTLDDCIVIHPVNTKGYTMSCWVAIPQVDIERFISSLRDKAEERRLEMIAEANR